MSHRSIVFFVFACLTVPGLLLGQIRINSLPKFDLISQDSLFFGATHERSALSLDGAWHVYPKGSREEMSTVGVPCNFTGVEELTFEKEIDLTAQQLTNNKFQLFFLGLNYSAEIIVNNLLIYKHPGGDFPFHVDIPRDVLKPNKRNLLAVRVFFKLQSESTIPVSQRYLFPRDIGGIFRDVYLNILPLTYISNLDFSYRASGNNRANLFVSAKIENHPVNEKAPDSSANNAFTLRVRLLSPSGEDLLGAQTGFDLPAKKEKVLPQSFDLSNLTFWTPQVPYTYSLRIQLLRGDRLVDEVIKPVSFFSLEASRESFVFNGVPSFILHGTTYYPSYMDEENLASYDKMREDIKLIKAMGFNAVRFAKAAPHPYLLKLCGENGLLAFIELPLNSIPQDISMREAFRDRVRSYLAQFIGNYKEYSAVAAIGLGGSYISTSAEHTAFLNNLADLAKNLSKKIVYASFLGFDIPEIGKLDLFGVEFLNKPMEEYTARYEKLSNSLGKGRVFVSEAIYATFLGSTNGYSNAFSYEAQAKFFSDLIDYVKKNQTPGYFINSIFDYRGDFASFSAGYNKHNLYSIGILGEDRQQDRLSQKVIFSKLHDNEDVTIPIGNKGDDSPIIFILYGLALAMLMGVLVNSRRKFREDATRALLRPYNFYSDIRDLRVMSGMHTTILMLVLSLCSALLQVNLLYFFRSNVLLEKIILSFGSPLLTKAIAYLAWNPTGALIWTTALSLLFFIGVSLIVKIASFFIRNRVFFTSVYFTVIWSFLPLILLLPLGLILYKVLNANVITIYLFLALAIFTIWIFYRLMKGIYVIFDVNPAPVYFYSLAIILSIIGGVLLYFQISESTINYIVNAIDQYKLM